MSSLTLSAQPGFTEIPDSAFNAGNAVSQATAQQLNADAKYAAVRNEQFWGFYKNGETVALPTSPADGYNYVRAELTYDWSLYSTAGPGAGALNGTQTEPTPAATGGGGTV